MANLFVFLLFYSYSTNFIIIQGQAIDFGPDEIPYNPTSNDKILNVATNSNENSKFLNSESKCECVSKPRCGDPGVLGPRQTISNNHRIPLNTRHNDDVNSSNIIPHQSNSTRIVNSPPTPPSTPPPLVACIDDKVYCCSILPEPQKPQLPLIPLIVPQPEKGYTCGLRSAFQLPKYPPVHGQAEYGKYPWMALVLDGNFNKFITAGALIDDFTILTAAHRVQNYLTNSNCKSLNVRLGEWNIETRDEPYPITEVKVDKVIIHSDFNKQSLENDIALIKIDPSSRLRSSYNPNINPVCLPKEDTNFIGEKCWVSGFGRTETMKHSSILREVDLKVIHGYLCQHQLQTVLGNSFILNQKSFICAGGEPNKDSCTKDGGSALVCEMSDGRYQMAGITAWGIGCGNPNLPGVYINVANYIQWINKYT